MRPYLRLNRVTGGCCPPPDQRSASGRNVEEVFQDGDLNRPVDYADIQLSYRHPNSDW
jgi:hypothetical protein